MPPIWAPWPRPGGFASGCTPKSWRCGLATTRRASTSTLPLLVERKVGSSCSRAALSSWAAGEFQYPNDAASSPPFPGFELCQHNSSVQSWRELPGDDFVVIGGYESGMDAAFNLSTCGKRCSVVSSTAYWNVVTADPSTELSPYTAEASKSCRARRPTPPKLLAPLRVVAVEAADEERGGYLVRARWGPRVEHQGAKFRLTHPVASASDCAEGSELTLRTSAGPRWSARALRGA